MKQIKITLILLLLFFSISLQSQVYNNPGGTITTCAGTFYDTGGVDGDYSSNESIVTTICSGVQGECLIVDFTSFSLESNYEFIYIYDGPSISATLIGSFTGTDSPETIYSTTGCLTFAFDSDGSVARSGWSADISCSPNCEAPKIYNNPGGTITTCEGVFYDTGGTSGNYAGGESIVTTICSEVEGECLEVDFTLFEIEQSYDNLSIYDGPDVTSTLIGSYTGMNSPGTVIATEGCLTFEFESDASQNRVGWAADISCIPNCYIPECPDLVIDFTTSGSLSNCDTIAFDLTANVSGTTNSLTYEWSTGDTIPSIIVTELGNYTVTVLDNVDGCEKIATYEVVETTTVASIFSTTTVLTCNTTSITLDGIGSTPIGKLNYQWLGMESTATSIEVSSPGFYSLEVYNTESGCKDTTTVNIIQDTMATSPIITVSGEFNCNNKSVTLFSNYSTNGNDIYMWSTGNSSQNIIVADSGTYGLTVTDGVTGCLAYATYELIFDGEGPVFEITATNDNLDCDNPTSLLTVNILEGEGPFIYDWIAFTYEDGPEITADFAAEYIMLVTDEHNGCSTQGSYVIGDDSYDPVVDIEITSSTTDCENPEATLTVAQSGETELLTYEWLGGETTPSINVDSVGYYRVTVTSEERGCTVSKYTFVNSSKIEPFVAGIWGDTTGINCLNPSIRLNSYPVFATYDYEWSTGESEVTKIDVTEPGTYTVTITNDFNGCTSTESFEVIAAPEPEYASINAPLTEITCYNPLLELVAVSNHETSSSNYSWSTGETTSTIYTDIPGTYTVTIGNSSDGCVDTASIVITADILAPVISVAATPSTILNDQNTTVVLDAGLSEGQGNLEYLWSNGDTNPMITVSNPGNYIITVTDLQNGCSVSDTIEVIEIIELYVDHTASGLNNGSSWENAFTDLQDALAIGTGKTIYIAKGTYYPTSGTIRGISFEMPSNVKVLGAFPNGGGERNLLANNETILSGNIDGVGSYSGNSYHVVTVKNVDNVILDGLSIRDGNADNANSFGRSRGGGLFVNNATLTLDAVNVKWNKAIYGAGMFATLSPSVLVENCTFSKNTANNGSAIYHSNETNLYIDKTRIIDNNSLVRCAIEVNNSLYTKIENSVIANNPSGNANAIAFIATNRDGACDIYNTTILGEMKNKFLITMQIGYGDQLDLSLYNSVISHQNFNFSNVFKDFNNGILNLNTTNCYIMGSTVLGNSSNNIYSATAGDLMLDLDYSLDACSPAVDNGDNAYVSGNSDIDGNQRIVNIVDIGAYENSSTCVNEKENVATIAPSIAVYPNPTKDKITIQGELENPRFYVFDLLGKEILNTEAREINLGELSQGIYILRIMEGNQLVESVKVIKN